MASLKTSELTPAATLTGAELVPLVQGAGNVSATLDQVIGLAASADLADLTSGTATSGQVPTADGSGGVDWAEPSGGTLDLAAAHAVALSF